MTHFSSVPHLVEEGSQRGSSANKLLPPDLYSQVLDTVVIACVDVLITHRDRVFLARRKTYPHPSWWFIGGRMHVGESPVASAQRKILEDTALGMINNDRLEYIAAERFHYVGTYSTHYARRQQPPQENGTHTLNLVYHLTVSPEEMSHIQLSDLEYAEGQWVPNDAIADYLDEQRVMHGVVRQVIQSLRYRDLENAFGGS